MRRLLSIITGVLAAAALAMAVLAMAVLGVAVLAVAGREPSSWV
jgi:hypothetical protein